jgi:hypothetical protein
MTGCVAVVAEAKLAAYAAYATSLGRLRRLSCLQFFLRASVRGLRNPG